jgi:hypothetical protein
MRWQGEFLTMKEVRYFAHGEFALENCSFVKVILDPAHLRGFSTWMNGDHMGLERLATREECDQKMKELVAEVRAEYTQAHWQRLVPRCCL